MSQGPLLVVNCIVPQSALFLHKLEWISPHGARSPWRVTCLLPRPYRAPTKPLPIPYHSPHQAPTKPLPIPHQAPTHPPPSPYPSPTKPLPIPHQAPTHPPPSPYQGSTTVVARKQGLVAQHLSPLTWTMRTPAGGRGWCHEGGVSVPVEGVGRGGGYLPHLPTPPSPSCVVCLLCCDPVASQE